MFALLLLLIPQAYASPTMCHCPNGALGMSCPAPIQLNCPQQQCPPAPPCNPFPTLPTVDPNNNGLQGLPQFTFPTLAPLPGSGFGASQPTTPIPLSPSAPIAGQDGLLPIVGQPQAPGVGGPTQPQPSFVQSLIPNPQQSQPAAQVNVQPPPPPPTYVEAAPPPVINATTKATTLASEQYVEQDSPEADQQQVPSTGDANSPYGVFENEPNKGYRQPVRRQASATKTEVFTEKCNDERLKKIIEQNVDSNPSTSKRKIQKAASDEIGGLFDVICSAHDFSYLANTQLFCEAGNDDVTCFAFLHSLIQ